MAIIVDGGIGKRWKLKYQGYQGTGRVPQAADTSGDGRARRQGERSMMSDAGSQWRECRAGEIGRMVRGQQEARRRRRLQRTVPILGSVLVLLLAAVFLPSVFQPVQRLSLDCSQVLRLAREYSAGTLDPELRAAVEQHLEGCPGCRERFSHEASGREQAEASGVAELRVDGQPLRSGRPLPSQDSGFVAVR